MSTKKFGGSSLDRKNSKQEKKENQKKEKNLDKIHMMSSRTKSKIKRKIIAFSQIFEKLSFVTLTFANEISDLKAVKILRMFLDNVKK